MAASLAHYTDYTQKISLLSLDEFHRFLEVETSRDANNNNPQIKKTSLFEILQIINASSHLGSKLIKKKKNFTQQGLISYFNLSSEQAKQETTYLAQLVCILNKLNQCPKALEQESRLTISPGLKALGAILYSIALASILFDIFTVATNIPGSPFCLSASLLSLHITGIVVAGIIVVAIGLAIYLYQRAVIDEARLLYKWKCTIHKLELAQAYQGALSSQVKSEGNLVPESRRLGTLGKWLSLKFLAKLGEGFSTYMSTLFWNICSIGSLLGFSIFDVAISASSIIIPIFAVAALISIGIFIYSIYLAHKKKEIKSLFLETEQAIEQINIKVARRSNTSKEINGTDPFSTIHRQKQRTNSWAAPKPTIPPTTVELSPAINSPTIF